MTITKAQQRLAEAKRAYDLVKDKHDYTLKRLIHLNGKLHKASRDVVRCTKAVRQERKDTKAAMAQAVEDTRAFDGDLGHLTP